MAKADDDSGRYSRGAGSKPGLVDVAFKVSVVTIFTREHDGLLRLRVTKDRRGYLHRAHDVKVGVDGGLAVSITENSGDDHKAPSISPAARKILDALLSSTEPLSGTAIVDRIAARHGHGLTRETVSRNLSDLVELGLVQEPFETGAGKAKYWSAVAPDSARFVPETDG